MVPSGMASTGATGSPDDTTTQWGVNPRSSAGPVKHRPYTRRLVKRLELSPSRDVAYAVIKPLAEKC
jgi:hypothetical protein